MAIIDKILVPKGAELRTLSQVKLVSPIVPIPAGIASLNRFLVEWEKTAQFQENPPKSLLLMGLCGGLSPNLSVGSGVIYESCQNSQQCLKCDHDLTNLIFEQLFPQLIRVKGITSERVITSRTEKQQLARDYGVEVVDMEGIAVLEFGQRLGIPVALVRVVSDDAQHNLPDFKDVFDEDGNLQSGRLTKQMLSHPVAAWHLIRGSLKALNNLQILAKQLVIFEKD